MTDLAMDSDGIAASFLKSLKAAPRTDEPYPHWHLKNLFPESVAEELMALNFPLQQLDGVSGKRELHNDTRHYFDQGNAAAFPVVAATANAFGDTQTIKAIEDFFGISLHGTFLRIEYAQDIEGFWLEPHTDLGVKKLTVLIYLAANDDHSDLGTDIFNADKSWAARMPFEHNSAMAFVPSDNTFHGFQQRPIKGVRKSLILNYVTDEWRAREQLAFPAEPANTH